MFVVGIPPGRSGSQRMRASALCQTSPTRSPKDRATHEPGRNAEAGGTCHASRCSIGCFVGVDSERGADGGYYMRITVDWRRAHAKAPGGPTSRASSILPRRRGGGRYSYASRISSLENQECFGSLGLLSGRRKPVRLRASRSGLRGPGYAPRAKPSCFARPRNKSHATSRRTLNHRWPERPSTCRLSLRVG